MKTVFKKIKKHLIFLNNDKSLELDLKFLWVNRFEYALECALESKELNEYGSTVWMILMIQTRLMDGVIGCDNGKINNPTWLLTVSIRKTSRSYLTEDLLNWRKKSIRLRK